MKILNTVVGNLSVLRLWSGKDDEKSQSTVLHFFHAFFALGGLMAPIIAKQFLADYTVIDLGNNSSSNCDLGEQLQRNTEDDLGRFWQHLESYTPTTFLK
jgi:hypothetical protein